MLDDFAADLKAGHTSSARALTDKSRTIRTRKHAIEAGKKQGIKLNDSEIRAMLLPNSDAAIGASLWLESYFEFHGDIMPNMLEIHLEPINRCVIFHEYVDDMNHSGQSALSITRFLFLWNEGFPNVKIREYKAVTGEANYMRSLFFL